MGLLDGAAAVFGGIMGSYFLDAQLHRIAITFDGEGGGSDSEGSPEDCKAQVDRTIERLVNGVPETLQSILVLQQFTAGGVAAVTARPSTDDEITIGSDRWQIATVETDPANAYWLLGGRKVAPGSGS